MTHDDEPLIHTSKGNMLVSDLRYVPSWDLSDKTRVIFRERYYDNDDLVRENAHVCVLDGASTTAHNAQIAG